MATTQGIGLMLGVLGLYFSLPRFGYSPSESTTICFATLVLGNLSLIVVNRSKSHDFIKILKNPNPSQKWVVSLALATFIILISIPALRQRFQLSALMLEDFILIITVVLACIVWYDLIKWVFRKLPN